MKISISFHIKSQEAGRETDALQTGPCGMSCHLCTNEHVWTMDLSQHLARGLDQEAMFALQGSPTTGGPRPTNCATPLGRRRKSPIGPRDPTSRHTSACWDTDQSPPVLLVLDFHFDNHLLNVTKTYD